MAYDRSFSRIAQLNLALELELSSRLLKSTAITGGMTLVSRVTGLIRDNVLARIIGAGEDITADAFFVAFRIPNFFRRIFAEGAFSQAFVPVYSEHRQRATAAEQRAFLDYVAGLLGTVLLLVTVVGVVIAPLIVTMLAPGFLAKPEQYELTVRILRITFPYLAFISLVALAAGILNTHERFAIAAFTPVLLNLSLIAAALWLAPAMENAGIALAWGIFIAGVVQLVFQIPALRRIRALPRPRLAWRQTGVARVIKLMLPAVFGSSVAQINMLVNTLLASFLVTGSVSWLYYSDRLMEFPLGVFGIALATVILPTLSRKHANASPEEFSRLLDWALRWAFLVGTPASIGLIVLAGPILTTIFHYGKFSENDVEMTARALITFSIGLLAFILVKILASGFYARQNTATPARVAALSVGANIVLSLALVYPLAHAGLALAISLAAFINAGLLFRLLRRDGVYSVAAGWGGFLLRIGIASLVMAVVVGWGAGSLVGWMEADFAERVLRLTLWISVGVLVYSAAILLSGIRPKQLMLDHLDQAESDV
ncbi:MAG: murein biosynthesis integral membrane protein MurJ [Acidiferrobacterales bacterium]